MNFVLATPIGVVIGVLLGMLGGGGAILAVPALVYLLGQQPRAATFASLIIVVISASAALAGHWRAGRVRFGAGATFAAAGLVGSFLGSRVSIAIDPNALLLSFATLMLVIAAIMAMRLRKSKEKKPVVERTMSKTRQVTIFVVTATGIGFLTG